MQPEKMLEVMLLSFNPVIRPVGRAQVAATQESGPFGGNIAIGFSLSTTNMQNYGMQ